MVNFKMDLSKTTRFPHYWEMCVGSCRAYTALREDYRIQLKKAHDELGFQYVRFHGLFNDDMCVCVEKRDMAGNTFGIVYNFVNTDNIFDFLLRIGMKPFIELGFMPTCLASGTKTCFHYKGNITPPADYDKWKHFIHAFTEHIVERYGLEEVKLWFFEVWNEPNLPFFFSGTQEDYFKLYQASAEAIKSVSPELKVGGPSTSINAWVPETIEFCKKNDVPLDFISTHHYPTDDPLWRSGIDVETFFKSGMYKNHVDIKRGTLTEMCTRTMEEAQGLPLYYTEWNVSANTNHEIHDTEYAAAMIAKTLADNDGLVEAYSFWTFTDIFEESSQLCGFFHGGFGLQTVAGVEKPAYRLFEIMHGLGDTRIAMNCDVVNSTVEALAVKGENHIKILLYNHNLEKMPIEPQEVTISLGGIGRIKSLHFCRIDALHANSYSKWLELGKPEYPKQEVVEQLREASKLLYEKMEVTDQVSVTIPEYGVYLLEIEL